MSDLGIFPGVPGATDAGGDAPPPELLTGRFVSLRFLTAALRRLRRYWIGLAVLGLVIGAGYHLVTPPTYWATSTLYLAHPTGSNDAVISANDLTMVRTVAVGANAAALLHEPDLSPLGLLGEKPASAPSDNIMVLSIAGPTPTEAVRRVNAVAKAYLAFRAEQYGEQNQAVVSTTNQEIHSLDGQINYLTTHINAAPNAQAASVAGLIQQRSGLEEQVSNLQQTVQADDLAATALSRGSRVVTAGTLAPVSQKKMVVVDGATGLVGGLAIGLLVTAFWAVISDRLWRREDIAGVLGVPVDLSIPRSVRRRTWRALMSLDATAHASIAPTVSGESAERLVHYLEARLTKTRALRAGLVIAVDDVEPAAGGVVALARRLARLGRDVVVVDATEELTLGEALSIPVGETRRLGLVGGGGVAVVSAPMPWDDAESDEWWDRAPGEWASADVVLVVATIDPASGARHLATWAGEAVLTVTAGRSSAERLNVVAELLAAGGVPATSAVLLGADPSDESIGLPAPVTLRSVGTMELVPDLGYVSP